MAATAASPAPPRSTGKMVFFAIFGLVTLFVTYGKNHEVLNPASQMAQHYAPVKGLLIVHGVLAALAMTLAVFQFSNRLRARYLELHRVLGYTYVVSVFVSAPIAIPIAARIDSFGLGIASAVQGIGWAGCTAAALYAVRHGNVAEHRRWMMRGYPFAMVFTVTRMIVPIPAIQRMGITGVEIVVWTTVALAAIVPQFIFEWPASRRRPTVKAASA